ncbi:MAG: polysaccharide biosynthesis C-terminal domain-containing protein [Ruminococcus sp.]|uniref:oligosaccharide flippase family protein n=1 Tax=Ruminococcus sp. TaxID=41978 RepID=UPI0025E452A6|nr:polysaccharide biosynthesis C-terminal domain-containing protein [Ruminococcus sp.]MBO4866920.1 polysaccharide biosynthesis C-terminal domain-containing protein [Ruminococcus sp.]
MKKQGFLKGSAILVGMVAVTKVLGLVYKVPLANILGGTGMGYFSAAFSVFTPVFALAAAGICPAMAKLTAEKAALGRYADLRRQRRTALIVYTLTSLTACICLYAVVWFGTGVVSIRYALYCLAPSVLFCGVMNVERGYYEGLGNMLPTAFSEIAETVFRLGLGLGLAVYIKNVAEESFAESGAVFGIVCETSSQAEQAALPFIAAGAVLGSTAASCFACVGLLIFTAIHGDGLTDEMISADPVTESSRYHAKELIGLSFPIAIAAVVTTLTGMLDMLTLPKCLELAIIRCPQIYEMYAEIGKSELPNFLYGSYEGLAVMLYGLVPTLTAMLGKSALPSMTESLARHDRSGLTRDLRRMLTLSATTAIPCGLGMSAMSSEVLELLFSGRKLECIAAQQPLMILGISVICCAMALPCFTVIQALGKPSRVTTIMLAGAAIKLGLNIALVPLWGLNGAAVSELVRSFFVCAAALVTISRLTGSEIGILKLCLRPLYAGVMCAVSARLFCDALRRLDISEKLCALGGILGGGIVCLTAFALLFDDSIVTRCLRRSRKAEKNAPFGVSG